MAKLLLIDGNNLAFRVHWTHKELSYQGTPVSLLFGFLKSLIYLRKKFEGYFPIVAWDGGYERRKQESQAAVERGLIPSGYKDNRPKNQDEYPDELQDLFEQMDSLKRTLGDVKILQVCVSGYEADDVIYSYVHSNLESGGESIVVTSDKDYFQLLEEGVVLFDAMKHETWTRERFMEEMGVEPPLWVDVGALMGDKTDNIFGVTGVGEKYALKFVKEYGDLDGVMKGLAEKKKRGKKEQAVLDSPEVVKLAKSLKKMDVVPGLPGLRIAMKKEDAIKEVMVRYGFTSLLKDAWRLVS